MKEGALGKEYVLCKQARTKITQSPPDTVVPPWPPPPPPFPSPVPARLARVASTIARSSFISAADVARNFSKELFSSSTTFVHAAGQLDSSAAAAEKARRRTTIVAMARVMLVMEKQQREVSWRKFRPFLFIIDPSKISMIINYKGSRTFSFFSIILFKLFETALNRF